jgi:predicted  nucleic acid-binding Zn-ribbon protein
MYTTKPLIETTEFDSENQTNEKRIKFLEDKVRQLTEQLNRVAAAIELNGKQIRRQNSNIQNVNSSLSSLRNR